MSIRMIIADDHPIVLRGLSHLFRQERDLAIVAECGDADSTLRQVRRHKPDVLVLDLRIPEKEDGLRVLRELHSENSATSVVLLTAILSDEDVLLTMGLGAKGIVLKEMATELLIKCIRKVSAGGQWLEKESVGRALDRMLRREKTAELVTTMLTARETEVFDLVIGGHSNAAIAERLFVTEGTIKTHLHTIYDKLGIRGRVPLMIFARDNGLASRSCADTLPRPDKNNVVM